MARPTCPTTCSGASSVPALDNDLCASYMSDSTIGELYFSDAGMTDWTDGTEWTTKLDQAGGTGNIIKLLIEGTMGDPEQEFLEGINGVKKGLEKTYTIEGVSHILTSENDAAMRAFECGTSLYLIGYRMKKDKTRLWGYSEQDVQVSITTNRTHEGGNTPTQWKINLEWEDTVSPEFITSPI